MFRKLILILFLAGSLAAEDTEVVLSRSAASYYNSGLDALARGKAGESLQLFRLSLEKNPSYVRALTGAGEASLLLSDYSTARQYFERALSLEEENLRAKTGLGRALSEAGYYEEAEKYFNEVREKSPADPANLFAIAKMHRQRGRIRLAEGYLNRLLRSNPAHKDALIELAQLEASKGQYEQAQKHLDLARRIAPHDPNIYLATGRFHYLKGLDSADPAELEQAAESYRTALELAGSDAEARKELIRLDYQRGRPEDALDYVTGLEGNNRSESAILLANLYYALYEKNNSRADLQKAMHYLNKACETGDTFDPLGCFWLEQLALSAGPEAESILLRRADYHSRLAGSYEKRALPDLMRLHYLRSLAMNPDSNELLRRLLDRYRLENNFEMFLKTLILLRDKNPEEPAWQFRLDRALQQRRKSLSYRENLISPETDPVRATFIRTPARILLMDFKPASAEIPYHIKGPQLIKELIEYHLTLNSRLAPVPETVRISLLRTRTSTAPQYLQYLYYTPDLFAALDDEERGLKEYDRSDYILRGDYSFRGRNFYLNAELMERSTGRIIKKYSLHSGDQDSLHIVAGRLVNRISDTIPLQTRIIKTSGESIFLNTGRADGVEKGFLFEDKTLQLVVTETGSYVSRAVIRKGDATMVRKGRELTVSAQKD